MKKKFDFTLRIFENTRIFMILSFSVPLKWLKLYYKDLNCKKLNKLLIQIIYFNKISKRRIKHKK